MILTELGMDSALRVEELNNGWRFSWWRSPVSMRNLPEGLQNDCIGFTINRIHEGAGAEARTGLGTNTQRLAKAGSGYHPLWAEDVSLSRTQC